VLHDFGGRNDGTVPYAPVVAIENTLYGTTSAGGTSNKGTVYELNL
jgi:uncharacterized repeat protein (TIGR03803 family)